MGRLGWSIAVLFPCLPIPSPVPVMSTSSTRPRPTVSRSTAASKARRPRVYTQRDPLYWRRRAIERATGMTLPQLLAKCAAR
jgi:hypothetical protein